MDTNERPRAGRTTPRESTGRVFVVGGGQTGRRLAEQLAPHRPVHHVDETSIALSGAWGYATTHVPDIANAAALEVTGITAADAAVVVAGRDSRTLLVTQLLRTRFGVDHVWAVLNHPQNRGAFTIPGVTVVEGAGAVTEGVLAAAPTLVGASTDADEGPADTPEPGPG